ncbi:MAG: shikimate kinase [Terrimonas sp.]|nr:shikimate kinase [Terrimonas sp.]
MKIYLIGFMGSGKTFRGRQLSQKLGIPFFDLDEQVVNQEGISVKRIFEEKGEEYFRMAEKEALHIITESHDAFVMATGGGTPCYFNNIEYMKKSGTTVWINTPHETLFNRLIREKEERPLLNRLSDEQLRSFIIKKYADRKIYYEQSALNIDDENTTLEELTEKIVHV